MNSPVPVAEIVRSGFVEGRHHGSVVALGGTGDVEWSVGDVDSQVLPRSCNKPIQALAMLRNGLDLSGADLALACASHSGEPFHVDGVRRLLSRAGLEEQALQCPPDHPGDTEVWEAHVRAGGEDERVLMNCSGKHAAMLLTCVGNGWSTERYLDPESRLQQAILDTFIEMTGEEVEAVAVDGCGAPLLSTSLTGLARAFHRLALGLDGEDQPDPLAAAVAEAIRSHPEVVSGTGRDLRALLAAVPGAIGKDGAEACHVVALADGRTYALKVEDGSARARPVVMAAALARDGVDREPGVDGAALRRTGEHQLLGGGEPVGEVRACL